MSKTKFLLLYGYGWSGSGAILDLAKEIRSIKVSDTYFFLLRDSNGLLDLENNLLDNWDVFRSSCAIKNFLKLCNRSKKPMLSPFTVPGRGYRSAFGDTFDRYIDSFIETITDFKYYSYEHTLNMGKGFGACFISRLIHNLDKRGVKFPVPEQERYYFSRPSRETYFNAAQSLIKKIYDIENQSSDYLLIDHHPLPVQCFNKADDYFGKDTKMIVVDRDPRDIYVDLVDNRMRIGSELYRYDSVEKYIEWHKKSRVVSSNKNLLKIRFEDAVLEYEETRQRIFDFLGIDKDDHINQYCFFDPNVSKHNIGIWKKYKSGQAPEIFDKIYKELKEFCYET